MAESSRLWRRCWKRHIVRQLKQRDRAQKALFLGLVLAYNKLLEKSNLDNFIAKLQTKSLDNQMGLPPASSTQESSDSAFDAVLDSAQRLVKRPSDPMVQLESINELAYRVYEWNILLKAKDAALEEQRGRLASLRGQVSDLEAKHRWLQGRVEERSCQNAAVKEGYDALREVYRRQDGEFRQEAERGLEVLKQLMRQKVEAAEIENERIERAKQTRLSKELKKATKTVVRVKAEPKEEKLDKQKMATQDVPEAENGEKLLRRPFRSASATSMTLTRYVDVFKGLLDFMLKRGNSISNMSTDRYCSIPCCVAACLPSTVSDIQEAHVSEINAIRFSPNSSMLATGGTDRLIRLWNVVGGWLENMQTLDSANGSITSVAFDPSGCHVLAATYNNAAQLWKLGDGQFKEILTGHADKVTAAEFRSTQCQAVTGSRDRTVKEWDLGKGACSRTINVFSYCNDLVCCDPILISGHRDKTIRFWDSRGLQLGSCTTYAAPYITQGSPGGQLLLLLLPYPKGPPVHAGDPVEGKVTSLSISQDQMHLLSCSRDNALKVIDLRMHNIRQVFRAEGFKCSSDGTKAVFSPDKSYALVGSADGTLFLWNIETGKLETSLPGVHRSSVNAVAWIPSGTYIGSVDRSKTVVLWR